MKKLLPLLLLALFASCTSDDRKRIQSLELQAETYDQIANRYLFNANFRDSSDRNFAKYHYYDSLKKATKAKIDSIRVEADLKYIEYLKKMGN